MPGVDWIPGISQIKAGLQLITGDVEGAARTTENFAKECPVVSQVTSLVQLATGDTDGALDTQMRCLGTVNNVTNSIPVVGHVKGVVHHIVGDHEGGNQALNAATRSTVVIGSGAAAGLATGGLGAIPAGIAAGGAYDITATVVTEKPQGYVAAIGNAIENPSAGSIFDAAVIPVGDGLAGYSGGQVANKVATQMKLSSLEAVRDAKMDQLNTALDQTGGGGGGMTSGQAHSLGLEINALTRDINVIRQGTPQYWFDPKSNQVTVDLPANNVAVPVIGYVEENEKGREAEIMQELYKEQESGFLADLYAHEAASRRSVSSKQEFLKERKNQAASGKPLKQLYPRVPFVTRQQLQNLKQQFERNDPNSQLKRLFTGWSWLHVQMPRQFNYTGAIMVNSATQGLLHSFVRHSDQWVDYVANMNSAIGRVAVLREHLERSRNAETPESASAAARQFIGALRGLDNETFITVQSTLNDMQLDMHQFIQDNVTYENYLGEGLNVHDQQQVYFKVKDKNGNVRVMTICVSDEMGPPDSDFPDGRPIRTITTVFFITWEVYLKRKVMKLF